MKTLKKYKLTSGFYSGIQRDFPGSGYIDFYENNMFILSARGVLAFRKNLENTATGNNNLKDSIKSINELVIPISSEKSFVKKRIINISDNINRFNTKAKAPMLNFLFFVLVSFDTVNKSEIKFFNLVLIKFH